MEIILSKKSWKCKSLKCKHSSLRSQMRLFFVVFKHCGVIRVIIALRDIRVKLFFQQSTSSKLKDVKLWGWKMCTQAKEMKLQWRRNSKTLMTKRGNHCSPPILHIPRFLNTKFLQNTGGGKSETKMTVWISLQNRSLLHDYRWRAYHFESLNNGKESLF